VLHDIEDGERLAAWVIRRSGLTLSHEDHDDAQRHLLVEAWKLSLEFNPACDRPFVTFATALLGRRLVDWQRGRFGRTVWKFRDRVHERPRTQFAPFDDAIRDRTDAALAMRSGDSEADRLEAERWLHEERDRHRTRDLELPSVSAMLRELKQEFSGPAG
jgi:hypothetical protein